MSKVLLASFAHPDDEAFGPAGTLAKLARQGVAVHLITATRGEAGESDLDDLGECEDLGCERELELRCAADVLGLADVHLLDYRDSGMAGADANRHPQALVQADPDVLAGQVAELMRAVRPQVVLTFDPYGVYGHPDHIAIHQATISAFYRLSAAERPQKLYFVVASDLFSPWMVSLMPLFGVDPGKIGKNHDINLRAAVEHRLPVTTRVDIAGTYDLKQEAAACHSSQLSGPGSAWGRLPGWLVRRLLSRETFYRAVPPFHVGEPVERDLFEGVV